MAVRTTASGGIRVEDLDALGVPEKFVELVDGEVIHTTPAGSFHNTVAYNVVKRFDAFCASRPELTFAGDNEGFLIRRNSDSLLSPDACLYRRRPTTGTTWLPFAPEVAVEVISPSNTAPEMVYKRHCFFEAGAEQFWLVDPTERTLQIYFRNGRVVGGGEHDVVAGEGICAGLEVRVQELFRER